MITRMFFRTLAIITAITAGGFQTYGQSLFDEIILDGETVSASSDTTTVILPDSVAQPELTIAPWQTQSQGKNTFPLGSYR